jgi:cytochrome c
MRGRARGGVRGAVLVIVALCISATACTARDSDTPALRYGVGRAATSAEVAAMDVDVAPDGAGLPPGSGSVARGEVVYAARCASCHGARGEGTPAYPRLVGRDSIAEGFPFARDARLERTIGNYWPYATTVFDYVRRAMPPEAPGSLADDDVYAVTAWLLAGNGIIPASATLDSASLVRVVMPYRDRFVPDDRAGGRVVR